MCRIGKNSKTYMVMNTVVVMANQWKIVRIQTMMKPTEQMNINNWHVFSSTIEF